MQRDLRFRAWDGKNMVLGFFNMPPQDEITQSWDYMQFTGLLDKNGKEIYEGDWCRFTHRGEAFQTKQGVVEFYNTGFRAVVDDKDDALTLDRYYEIEVIGNIYENKELMEQIYD